MKTNNNTGPLVFTESRCPISGRVTVAAVRFETIELTKEEAENIRFKYLADEPDPRLLWLRNYILFMCQMTPHVTPSMGAPAGEPIETDNQDEGKELGN